MSRMPKTLGGCADRLFRLKNDRRKAQRRVDEIKAEEREIVEHLIKQLSKSRATGVAGRFCRVQIKQSKVPTVSSWPKFYEYITETGQFDLLQKRIATTAVRDRWENEEVVPGVQPFTKTELALLKK